ncbi:MAG: TerB family tellurite resistance protein [Bacteroidota bacterium]|nr:TerB family tellurite resistance protein [Bacteroidota bacterium]
MSFNKWIGAGAGWFLAGPIGAIIGYYIGKNLFSGKNDQQKAYEVSLLILSSLVIKADGKVLKKELDYVKTFFTNTFGINKANQYFKIFNTLNKQSLSSKLRSICLQLNSHVNHAARLEIIHFLFGLSASDGDIHVSEVNLIKKISNYLNINQYDFQSIQAMFVSSKKGTLLEEYFKILELKSNASIDEVKKAYRKMAMKYHPDKLDGVSDDIKRLAEEKFLKVKEAYDAIIKNKS